MSRRRAFGWTLGTIAALAWLASCSDNVGPGNGTDIEPEQPLEKGIVVSDPAESLQPMAAAVLRRGGTQATQIDDVAFVSLVDATADGGTIASIRSLTSGVELWTSVRNGGFDPVPLPAGTGDSVVIQVYGTQQSIIFQTRVQVTAARAPIVARTTPPRKKRDVPLNTAIVIAFSEPVAPATLTASSVLLLRVPGGLPVAGSITLLGGTGTLVAFTPSNPLEPNREYRIIVNEGIRDLDGAVLGARVNVAFTTGSSTLGPPSQVRVSPDTAYLIGTGPAYQLSATVFDAAGNMLINQPVTWATSDPTGLEVSQTGLLTPRAVGSFFVTATVDGVTGAAQVFVPAGAPDSITVTPADATVGASGDTIKLQATVRDAAGRVLPRPVVTWTSSDTTLATVAFDSTGVSGSFATVTGMRVGSATITAVSGPVNGTTTVTVIAPPASASITITPDNAALVGGETVQLLATVRAASGKVLAGRAITWTTDDPAVATVTATGRVTGGSVGSTRIIGTSESVSDTVDIAVAALVVPVMSAPLTAGEGHSCALFGGETAYCWGENRSNQLGDGTNLTRATPVAVSGGLSFVGLTSGLSHTCGLAPGGVAYCWGRNNVGQLGDGSTTNRSAPTAVTGGITFNALAAGSAHTCGLTNEGALYCWGANGSGQLGIGSAGSPSLAPVAAAAGLRFTAITAGALSPIHNNTCALTRSGIAYCWGDRYGASPVAITGTVRFVALAIAQSSFCGLTDDGGVYCWGESYATSPEQPLTGQTFVALTGGGGHFCALTGGGAAHCWGRNLSGELGDGSTTSRTTPVPVLGGLQFTAVAAGMYHSCARIAAEQTVYCWGDNAVGQLGDNQAWWLPAPVSGGLSFTALRAGWNHACGLSASGELYCWGGAHLGQIGDGTTVHRSTPARVFDGVVPAVFATGLTHTCAKPNAGGVHCWGNSFSRHLISPTTCSDGASTNSPIAVLVTCFPPQPAILTGLVAGERFTCGLDAVGAAYCWGANIAGELGIGTTGPRAGPSPVSTSARFTALAAGVNHACGLTGPGVAYCWGFNSDGGLGDGSTTNRSVPVAVTGGLTFSALIAGAYHTCGLTNTGLAYCWGANSHGQLGDGSLTRRMEPALVSGGLTFSTLAAGPWNTCGLTNDGTTYCWGDNSFYGQVGDPSLSGKRTEPFAVPGAPLFSALAVGGGFVCGLTAGGTVQCWGGNDYGKLGRGVFPYSTTPVRVADHP